MEASQALACRSSTCRAQHCDAEFDDLQSIEAENDKILMEAGLTSER